MLESRWKRARKPNISPEKMTESRYEVVGLAIKGRGLYCLGRQAKEPPDFPSEPQRLLMIVKISEIWSMLDWKSSLTAVVVAISWLTATHEVVN
jgi:hypothetical protein